MKLIVYFLLSVLSLSFSPPPECWLESKKFRYAVGDEAKIDFMMAENFEAGEWTAPKNHAIRIEQFYLTGEKDLMPSVVATDKGVSLKLVQEGTHVISMTSNQIDQTWSADKFASYLSDQSLDEVRAVRMKTNSVNATATTAETRFAKILVQAGAKSDKTFQQVTGVGLEIIPKTNPYNMKTGDYMECTVLLEGKPLPHILIKTWSRLNHTVFLQDIYTENDGTIKFPISTKGTWMVSTLRLTPVDSKGLKWKSWASSLVFGIE